MKPWRLAFALVFLATAASANQSTINPLLPAANSPLTSAPVRDNFVDAYNDINNLYTLVGSGGGGGGVSSVACSPTGVVTCSVASPTSAPVITIGLSSSSITFGTTAALLGGTVSSFNSINIGATTPGTGAFTTLSATGALSAAGLTLTTTPLAVASGGTGITTAPTNGQLLIGGTSGYTAAAITPGSNISITNGNGSIIIAATTTASSSVSLSSITSGTGANSIDNTSNAQTWAWTGLTTGTALTLSSSTITTGSLLALTATAGSAGKTLNVTGNAAISGTTTLGTAQIGAGNAIFTTATATNFEGTNALLTTLTATTGNFTSEALSGTATLATAQIGAGNAIFTTATATNFEGTNALVTTLTATTANFTNEALSGTATLATAQIGAGNAIFTTATATNFEGTNALVTTLTATTGHFTSEALSGTATLATAQIGAGNAIFTTATATNFEGTNALVATFTATGVATGGFFVSPPDALSISSTAFTPVSVTSNTFRVVLTSACPCTIANPSGSAVDGERFIIEVWQPAASATKTVSWGNNYDFGTVGAPTLSTTTGAGDVVGFSYSAQNSQYLYLGVQQGM